MKRLDQERSGCHDAIHNASEVAHLKMWVEGEAPTSVVAEVAPATAEPASPTEPSKAESKRGSDLQNAVGWDISWNRELLRSRFA
jgi:hypothetical protein